ncbi:MAG: hypothetical protein AAF402_16390, partial [Pseudomonadota bacterium]
MSCRIKSAGSRENFDPNLFYDRESALEHLKALPSLRVAKAVEKILSFSRGDINWRVEFLPEEDTMHVDFSELSFEHAADVNVFYDFVEEQ